MANISERCNKANTDPKHSAMSTEGAAKQYNMPNTAATQYDLPVCTFNLAVPLETSDCVSLDESDTLVLIVLLIEGGHFLIEHLGHQPILREYHCDCKAATRRFNPHSDVQVL